MAHKKHKSPIPRILDIVKRLYSGEKLRTTDIALEYGKDRRTVHRDMLLINETISLKNSNGIWEIDRTTDYPFGNDLNYHLISAFANDMKIKATCLDRDNLSNEIISFAIKHEKLPKDLGLNLLKAIKKSKKITFDYKKSKDETTSRSVSPVKIFIDNQSDIWYLVALDDKDNQVKKFALPKIYNFKESDTDLTLSNEALKEADEIKTVWHSSNQETHTIKLYAAKDVASYFYDIKLHHSQTIECRDPDGGIEISCYITNKMEILPAIKSWMPHIHILEPKWLWEEMRDDLENYHKFESEIMRD